MKIWSRYILTCALRIIKLSWTTQELATDSLGSRATNLVQKCKQRPASTHVGLVLKWSKERGAGVGVRAESVFGRTHLRGVARGLTLYPRINQTLLPYGEHFFKKKGGEN